MAYRSPGVDRAADAKAHATRERDTPDWANVTVEQFAVMPVEDRNTLYKSDPDLYRRLRDELDDRRHGRPTTPTEGA